MTGNKANIPAMLMLREGDKMNANYEIFGNTGARENQVQLEGSAEMDGDQWGSFERSSQAFQRAIETAAVEEASGGGPWGRGGLRCCKLSEEATEEGKRHIQMWFPTRKGGHSENQLDADVWSNHRVWPFSRWRWGKSKQCIWIGAYNFQNISFIWYSYMM